MKCYVYPLVLVFIVFAAGCRGDADRQQETATADQPVPDREAVQSVMRDYIERATSEQGTMTVQGTEVTFDYLHDGIESKDGMLVSCADFKTAGGEVYDIDYYVDSTVAAMEVARVVFHKKGAEPVNEVLWARE